MRGLQAFGDPFDTTAVAVDRHNGPHHLLPGVHKIDQEKIDQRHRDRRESEDASRAKGLGGLRGSLDPAGYQEGIDDQRDTNGGQQAGVGPRIDTRRAELIREIGDRMATCSIRA